MAVRTIDQQPIRKLTPREEEIRRREFCIDAATMLDNSRPHLMIAVAEDIYAYCYGKRPKRKREE
jgi:hypothetical protein